MSLSVQEILKNYSGEGALILKNLKRLLNHGSLGGSGKLLILPVDQGFEHGPLKSFNSNPSAFDPFYHFELALKAGLSAYAAPPGFLEIGAHKYAKKLPLILKINSSDSLYKDANSPCPSLNALVEKAVDMKCVGVGYTIYPGSPLSRLQYERFAEISHKAKKKGLLVILWSYPRGGKLDTSDKQTALDVICYASHIACQLGAHIIKVKAPGDFIFDESFKDLLGLSLDKRVQKVLQSCFNKKRILIFSGGGKKDEKSFLEEIRSLKKGGAFGSIVGRNAFQRTEPEAISLLKKIIQIYKS